jgi:acyl-CoA thioester hydrolase
MTGYRFVLELKVRDYELDAQGVVNNAVYQNYLEYCRHEFLLSQGIDFIRLAREKTFLVVVRAELDYMAALRGGDAFRIGLNLKRSSPLRFDFLQDIFRLDDQRQVLRARTTGTAVNEKGRPFLPPALEALLTPVVKSRPGGLETGKEPSGRA